MAGKTIRGGLISASEAGSVATTTLAVHSLEKVTIITYAQTTSSFRGIENTSVAGRPIGAGFAGNVANSAYLCGSVWPIAGVA